MLTIFGYDLNTSFWIFNCVSLETIISIATHKSIQFINLFYDKIALYSIDSMWLYAGYRKIVVSSKPTASSFSFGQKHRHITKFDTDGPGTFREKK